MENAIKPVHDLSKREIFHKALKLKESGKLYNPANAACNEHFAGSIDRFCEIAYRLRACLKVLDVGAGDGLLLSLLKELGHDCYALDIIDPTASNPEIFGAKKIEFKKCNVEVDVIPYGQYFFDAVVCCQALEHFTHSHLHAVREMHRVLKVGGIIEIDVPNAVCFRNRSRMLRGKHITWDYEKHYLHAEPVLYKGLSFFPDRHNREFTLQELMALLHAAQFKVLDVYFLKSTRYRTGIEMVRTLGSMARDIVPSFRKSLIAFGEKTG
jgi:SAM-dependent methyltransferase